jgi:hypothetical protein
VGAGIMPVRLTIDKQHDCTVLEFELLAILCGRRKTGVEGLSNKNWPSVMVSISCRFVLSANAWKRSLGSFHLWKPARNPLGKRHI